MNEDQIYKFNILASTIDQNWRATEHCISKQWHVPALTLIYCFIDNMAFIAGNGSSKGVRKGFEGWLNEWVLPRGNLDCTATDLYGARCAIVHTMTPHSSLSEEGKARQVLYSYTEDAHKELRLKCADGPNEFVVVNVGLLHEEVKSATTQFFALCDSDQSLRDQVIEKAGMIYTTSPIVFPSLDGNEAS